MKGNRTLLADPIDELCQLRDEMRVIWIALGSQEEAEGYLMSIREHVNGITNRVDEVIKRLQGGAS
jgi:ABC-type Fe3+-hydroxamate transport system substrate-binding protein